MIDTATSADMSNRERGDQQSSQLTHGPGAMQHGPPSHGHADQHSERIPFSAEEFQAIKECQSESFWYRCVPLTVAFVGATQYATRAGYLKPKGKYGGIYRNVAAIAAGFVLGKFSYMGECRRKILALPNSAMAEAMRNKRKAPELILDMSGASDAGAQSLHTDYNPSLDLDPDRRIHHEQPGGLDDSHRPHLDNSAPPSGKPEPAGRLLTSYDDLRKQNRDVHDRRSMDSLLHRTTPPGASTADAPPLQQQQPVQPPPPSSSSSYQSSISSQSETRDTPDQQSKQAGQQPRKFRNQYGDLIE